MHKTFYVFSDFTLYNLLQSAKLPCVVCRINVAHFTNEETECMKKVEVEPYLRCLNSFFEYLTLYQCNHWNIPSRKIIDWYFVLGLRTDNKHREIIIFTIPHVIKVNSFFFQNYFIKQKQYTAYLEYAVQRATSLNSSNHNTTR